MKEHQTRSGIPLKPVYTPEDLKGKGYDEQLGVPGDFPYTRGRRADPTGGWMHRELSGEGDPARSNEQLKYLISQGQIGLDVIGDSPTMAFMDPDHPLAANAIGTQDTTIEAFKAGATMGEIGGAMRLAYNCPYDPHGLIEAPI